MVGRHPGDGVQRRIDEAVNHVLQEVPRQEGRARPDPIAHPGGGRDGALAAAKPDWFSRLNSQIPGIQGIDFDADLAVFLGESGVTRHPGAGEMRGEAGSR